MRWPKGRFSISELATRPVASPAEPISSSNLEPLLAEILDLFSVDDGGLPEICLQGLTGNEVEEIYQALRQATRFLVGSPVFRHRGEHADKPLDSVPNAARLVVQGEADPFHFLCRGITVDGVPLPDLGVFVLDTAVALDYERGPAWGPSQVAGLFRLVRSLFGRVARPVLAYDADNGRDESDRFARVLSVFCGWAPASAPADPPADPPRTSDRRNPPEGNPVI